MDRLAGIAKDFILTLLRHQVQSPYQSRGRTISSESITTTYNRLVGISPDVLDIEGSSFRSLVAEIFARETSEDQQIYQLFAERLKVIKDQLENSTTQRDLYKDARANLQTNSNSTGILDRQIAGLQGQVNEKLLAVEALVDAADISMGGNTGDLTNSLNDTVLALLTAEAETLQTKIRKLEIRRRSIEISRNIRQLGTYAKKGERNNIKVIQTSLLDFVNELIKLCTNASYRRELKEDLEEAGEVLGLRNTATWLKTLEE